MKVAVVKRCTRDGVVYCESCQLPAKRFQIDHRIADGLGGEPIIENAELICDVCFGIKNPQDTTKIAKSKRIEAKHLRAKQSTDKPKMQSRNDLEKSEKRPKIDKSQLQPLQRRSLYEDVT